MAGIKANRAKCSNYKSRGSRIKNKIRKLLKHLKWNPKDPIAQQALKLAEARSK